MGLEPRGYTRVQLSPDGSRAAIHIQGANEDIWLYDFERQTLTRFTFHQAADFQPLWTPDGERIAFASSRDGARQRVLEGFGRYGRRGAPDFGDR